MVGTKAMEKSGKTRRRKGEADREAGFPRIDSLSDLNEPMSGRESLTHITSEVFLVARLALKLWSYLGIGWRWVWNCSRLILYALILSPGFLQMVFYYYFSGVVSRSIPYGRKPRNRLDLYTPSKAPPSSTRWPVVIFVTGGAWTIGYKAWGALFGRRLSETGVMVVSLDYRNFPQGNALDMLEDINTGISWVFNRIEDFGGDLANVHLCGQSAGGHLASVALLSQVQRAVYGSCALARGFCWDPLDLQSFMGVSGAYCLETLAEHLNSRGLYKSLFEQIMTIEEEVCLQALSPLRIAGQIQDILGDRLPEVILLHGDSDKTVPCSSSTDFANVLKAAGVQCTCTIFSGISHTDPLVEGPMRGHDHLAGAMLEKVFGHPVTVEQKALVPGCVVNAAAYVCPF